MYKPTLLAAAILLVVLPTSSFGACSSLSLNQRGKNNLVRDLGIAYAPVSGSSFETCLRVVNHSRGAYGVLQQYAVADFVVFYRNPRTMRSDAKSGTAFTEADIYTGITRHPEISVSSTAVELLREAVSTGEVRSKQLTVSQAVGGWRNIAITVFSAGGYAAASLSARPPRGSRAEVEGVARLVAYTRPVRVSTGKEELPARHLLAVLQSLQPIGSDQLSTIGN